LSDFKTLYYLLSFLRHKKAFKSFSFSGIFLFHLRRFLQLLKQFKSVFYEGKSFDTWCAAASFPEMNVNPFYLSEFAGQHRNINIGEMKICRYFIHNLFQDI